jgi:site-specific DNA-adenine methylase
LYNVLRINQSRDTPETFFCLDPPYVGYEQGHEEIRRSSAMTNAQGRAVRNKVEVLTANYPIKAPDKAYDKPYNTKPDAYVGAS